MAKKKKSNAGRPTVMTQEVLQKLQHAFLMGCKKREACLYAEIPESTFYNYCDKNPEYVEKIEAWQDMPKLKSKVIINKKLEELDADTAKWYLERKAKDEFSTRSEQTGKDGEPITTKTIYIDKEEKEQYEKHIEDEINNAD